MQTVVVLSLEELIFDSLEETENLKQIVHVDQSSRNLGEGIGFDLDRLIQRRQPSEDLNYGKIQYD